MLYIFYRYLPTTVGLIADYARFGPNCVIFIDYVNRGSDYARRPTHCV